MFSNMYNDLVNHFISSHFGCFQILAIKWGFVFDLCEFVCDGNKKVHLQTVLILKYWVTYKVSI